MATKIIWSDGYELVIDATLKKQHGRRAALTKHKVEQGSDVADHRVKENYTFSLDGVMNEFTTDDEGTFTRRLAFERIESAYDNDDLLEVKTTLKNYKNMTIAGYSIPEEASQGKALFFSLDFEELRTAVSKTIKVDDIPKSALKKTSPKLTEAKKVKETKKLRKRASKKGHKGHKKPKMIDTVLNKYGY